MQPAGFRECPTIWEAMKRPLASLLSAGCEAGGGGGKVGSGEQPTGVVSDGCGEVHQADGLRTPGQNISGAGTGFCPGSSVSAGLESATPGGRASLGAGEQEARAPHMVPATPLWGL